MRVNLRKLVLGGFALATLIYLFSTEAFYEDPRLQSAWSLPLSGKIIFLDPGHGGMDGGAVSREGLVEKEVALAISIYLRDLLQQAGALVLMTRETDMDLATEEDRRLGRSKVEDLKNRINQINTSDADFLISIHLNSIPSPRWRGAQTIYHPEKEENRLMAELIQEELIQQLQNTTRKARANQDIFILRHANLPSVLVEVGFLSNPIEADLLATADYQKKVAAAIYTGIIRYYSNE